MHEIIYPEELTYFIAWDDYDNIGYGINTSEQCTSSGANNFETFTDEQLYRTRLLELGITEE